MNPQPLFLEFGMGLDVHGQDCTKAARRAVSDAIRHSSVPLLGQIRERGGTMLVEVTVAVPDPESVDLNFAVRKESEARRRHGEVAIREVRPTALDVARSRFAGLRAEQQALPGLAHRPILPWPGRAIG